jgi:hypothetical protein
MISRSGSIVKLAAVAVAALTLCAFGVSPAFANGSHNYKCGPSNGYYHAFSNGGPNEYGGTGQYSGAQCGSYGVRVEYEVTTDGFTAWTGWYYNAPQEDYSPGWPILEASHSTTYTAVVTF